ncbi:MAG: 30S ribosomal protein S9 [Candidatus Diapherotrites archaeon]
MPVEKKIEEKKAKKKKSRKKGITTKAKKKRAVARAVIKRGNGAIRINRRKLDVVSPRYVRELIQEPMTLAGDLANEVDISVNVRGGGFMGQAVAARGAIAKALLEFKSDEKLREKFIAYDRLLLVDDVRRVEPKKPLGPKARKKKQQSKR